MKIMVLDSCGDDVECGAGGTMAKSAKAGYEVIIGRISPLNENTVKSAGILGVKEEWLGFPKSPPPHYDDLWDTHDNGKKMDAYLKEGGILRPGKIGAAESMLMNFPKMVAAVVKKLQAEPAWLLCDHFFCEPCSLRKRRLREKGLI